MSTQCRNFVQNAWKKELCSNCFKSREEHNTSGQEVHRPIVARTANSVKRVAHKVQGILRLKESTNITTTNQQQQMRSKRKNVAFPDSLTEIIGYDGGDDLGSDGEEQHNTDDASDDPDSSDTGYEVDELPDSEEERALGNLTRANTNFNTVTANLTAPPEEVAKASTGKSFGSLMLGRPQKDGDGRKTTLLVTVTPFGADDCVPTAKRPSDKKSPEPTKPKPQIESTEAKTDLAGPLKATKKDDKSSETTTTTKTITSSCSASSSLGKIVDMPLITSTNLLSVMRDDTSTTNSIDSQKTEPKRATNIARTPAIKKPENEKPRIVAQPAIVLDQNAAKNHKNLEMSNGVERNNLSPIRNEPVNDNSSTFSKEIPNYKSSFSADTKNIADLAERKVEGEAASEKYRFEESRESAGEPDGKADEEVIAEPPALPKSPPPIESVYNSRNCTSSSNSTAEPRPSFLHGVSETKSKPVVPQKPTSLPASKAVGASLASLLSENRAYEFRLSQSQNNARNNALVHSQSESQLCGVDEVGPKRSKINAESCGLLTQSELYKATYLESSDKDEPTEEEPEPEENEDDSEASSTDQPRSCNANKRRMAPQPPSGASEDTGSSLFARNPTAPNSDCPVVREKEKRERASSCSPKFRKAVSEAPDPFVAGSAVPMRPPEPAPRRNISLSQDSLAAAACSERVVEEKKKSRTKFSLKKFLRMGTRKDVDMTGSSSGSRSDEIPSTPQPKPRLEIIHPLELDGAAVQVLRNDRNSSSEDTTDSKGEQLPTHTNSCQPAHGAPHAMTRPSKPPPPPRSQSLEESSRTNTRSSALKQPQQQQKQSSNGSKPLVAKNWQPSGGSSASDSIYANLGPAAAEDVAGVIRSGLAPAKPRRTSSMRDQQQQPLVPSRGVVVPPVASSITTAAGQQRQTGLAEQQRTALASDSSVSSECFTSSLECDDTSLELRLQGSGNHPITKRQSDSGAFDSNSNELKFQQSLFTRSTSLPYCASEAESELYSPFSHYHGDELSEENHDLKKDEASRIGRLRQRRGRSIVHRSLEDNYGAVIVANHEALAQFLEQTNQAPPIAAGLRGLKSANLQFCDFSIDRSTAVATGRRIFFSAVWNEQNVTVCVAFDPSMHVSRKEFYLVPIIEFIDTVPNDIAELGHSIGRKSTEATISVLPRLQVNTLKSFAETMSTESGKDENAMKESSFVLLQLVSALKSLQARGIEEAPGSLANVVLCREDKDAYHRLYVFQGLSIDSCENNEDEYVSLCQCALNALDELNLAKKLPLIQELLMREKAVTLSQVKSILEFSLWGPADATLGGPRERETALQRWLDLERATVLHALVRARDQLTVTDEYQLLFLVRTSAKIMCEASLLLDRQRNGLLMRNC